MSRPRDYEPIGPLYVAFNSAVKSGDLQAINRTARRLPKVGLGHALAICVAYRDEPELYERAALRWVGRFCHEVKGASLEDVHQVIDALEQLPDAPERTAAELERLIVLCRSRPAP